MTGETNSTDQMANLNMKDTAFRDVRTDLNWKDIEISRKGRRKEQEQIAMTLAVLHEEKNKKYWVHRVGGRMWH